MRLNLAESYPIYHCSDAELHCIELTLIRHTKLTDNEVSECLEEILSNFHICFFVRGPFTLVILIDNEQCWSGITKQHPEDKNNYQLGCMTALQRAVLEYIRNKYGTKTLKTTLYGHKEHKARWVWTLQDKPLIAISTEIK